MVQKVSETAVPEGEAGVSKSGNKMEDTLVIQLEEGDSGERGGGKRGAPNNGNRGRIRQYLTHPEGENEPSQTSRRVQGVCVGVVRRVRIQSKLSRTLHARRGTKLLDDLSNHESNTIKGAMVEGTGEECHRTCGRHKEDTVGGSL